MRFTLAFVALSYACAAVSASAVHRRQASIPSCATTCLSDTSSTGCQPEDDTCLCKDQAFISGTTQCMQSACTGQDLQDAEAASRELCAAVGVTLTSAAPSSTSSSSSPSSTSPSDLSPSSTPSTNAALSHGANVLAGLAVVGMIALTL